jgi:hypothetical protein
MTLAPEAESARLAFRRPTPYVGTAAYDEDDAPFFFGRSEEAATVIAGLRSTRLTILYGPSGVGKSSLLMAGVAHRLREEAQQTQDESAFAVCVLRSWRDVPVRDLQEAARAALQELAGDDPLPSGSATLVETLRAWTERAGTLLVVLDQFEEYLLHHRDDGGEELTGFGAELARIVHDGSLRVHVLLSIREDAWAELERFDGHIPVRLVNYVRLPHLEGDAAREAIEGPVFAWNRTLPARSAPYYVEGALIHALLAPDEEATFAVGGDGIETTFLQLVLDRLWRATVAQGAQVLTLGRLESLGGHRRIVESHVRGALGRLSPREQATAAACFRFLVTRATTKVALPAGDLAEWTRRPEPQVTAVLDKLCTGEGGRLLRAVALDAAENTRYELFHDVLAEPIMARRHSHGADRQTETRKRVPRVGTAALVLVTIFAGVTFWAIGARNDASHRYHVQQDSNRELQARILQLTKEQRVAAAQAVVVRKLAGQNAGVRAETARLQKTRTGLDGKIAKLRADNRRFAFAITRFNTWNAALAKKINGLDDVYEGLAKELEDLRAQQGLLRDASGTLAAEVALRATELEALTAENGKLSRKAAELGLSLTRHSANPPAAAPKPAPRKPTTATRFTVAGDVPGSDSLRRQVAVLGQQLAVLLANRARPADEARWLRKENALLSRQRDALGKENEQLEVTRAALESRNHQLEQTRAEAAAEHRTLTHAAAARAPRNRRRAKEIDALRTDNASLQSKTAKQVAALGATQRDVADLRAENKSLVDFLEPRVERLSRAALKASEDPQLAGLLAVKAYRLTPFDPDDAARPDVYNSLWLALKQLDENAASKLIAPVDQPSRKVGTTRSAVLAEALCARISRSLTREEWSRFLPAGAPYTAKAARPCP